MAEKRTEDMIHEFLEGGGGITQSKGHDQKLIVALMSYKGSLGNICGADPLGPQVEDPLTGLFFISL
jgi:hypothetical protein